MFLYEEVNWNGRILQVIARDWLIANAIHIFVRYCLKESNGRFEKQFSYLYVFEVEITLILVSIFFNKFEKFSALFQRAKYILIFFFLYCPTFSTYTNTVHCLGIQNTNSGKSELYILQKGREIQAMWRGITLEVKDCVILPCSSSSSSSSSSSVFPLISSSW